MINTWLRFCPIAALTLFMPLAWAAPVTLVSDPGAYSTPTASELATATTFIGTIPDIPPAGIVTALRNAPASLVNTGLDAQAPPLVLDYQNNELGVIPQPSIPDSCPGDTPVTITISQWEVEQTARTFPGTQSFGLGVAIMDSRNPSFFAPISQATISNPTNVEAPGSHVAPSRTTSATIADLAFYTFATGMEVSKIVEVAMVLEVAQSSWSLLDTPSITLEYDDSACNVAEGAAAVPVLSRLQMSLLLLLIAAAALISLRRFAL